MKAPASKTNGLILLADKGGLSDARLQSVDEQNVTFLYKDYRQPNGLKRMTLTEIEFARPYISHILPKGSMGVRHYGFLSNRCR